MATALAAVAVAATACGGGGSSTPHSAASTPTATTTPLSAAKASGLAAAAILTSADLPGFTAKPQTHNATDDANDKLLQDCVGIAAPTYVARNFGTTFTKGDLEIDSSADVVASPAEAQAELKALTGAKAADCIKQTLRRVLGATGASITSFTATPTKIPVAHSDGGFAYRLQLAATIQGQALHFTGDFLGSIVGPVEVAVSDFATGPTTFTTKDATALLTKASARVRAEL